jgi:hypothetical protein
MQNQWITDRLPDADTTVLIRLSDEEYPIWPGFHDGNGWVSADGTTVQGPVMGWMEMDKAEKMLDGGGKP